MLESSFAGQHWILTLILILLESKCGVEKNIALAKSSIIFRPQPQNISCAGHKLEVPFRSKEIFSELENQRFCKSDKILLFMQG